jgi:hypothetical protein
MAHLQYDLALQGRRFRVDNVAFVSGFCFAREEF